MEACNFIQLTVSLNAPTMNFTRFLCSYQTSKVFVVLLQSPTLKHCLPETSLCFITDCITHCTEITA